MTSNFLLTKLLSILYMSNYEVMSIKTLQILTILLPKWIITNRYWRGNCRKTSDSNFPITKLQQACLLYVDLQKNKYKLATLTPFIETAPRLKSTHQKIRNPNVPILGAQMIKISRCRKYNKSMPLTFHSSKMFPGLNHPGAQEREKKSNSSFY